MPVITPQTAPHIAANGQAKYRNGLVKRASAQAVKLRNLCYAEAVQVAQVEPVDQRERLARAQALCQLVKSWGETCQQERIAKGKPLPGSLRPSYEPRRAKRTASAPVEPDRTAAVSPAAAPTVAPATPSPVIDSSTSSFLKASEP